MGSPRIYLDHHATTPLSALARAAMCDALDAGPGNPSSPHLSGRAARSRLENARRQVAEALAAPPRELVFTSGGTEAVALAVWGLGASLGARRVFVDPGAHPCLRAAAEGFAAQAGLALEALPLVPGAGGLHDLEALGRRLSETGRGALLGVSLVQHETGGVADLEGLGRVAAAHSATLVVDAVQAFGKLPLRPGEGPAAAVAVSSHKIGGPAGVGALWLRAGLPIVQRQTGGGQERGLRAGTENLVGAVGFGAAASALGERLDAMPAVARRRDKILARLCAYGASVSDPQRPRVATAAHVAWPGLAAQELVAALDLEGVSVSSGAACSSGKAEPSESLLRMAPHEPWRAAGALRVSLGPSTTDDEVADFEARFARVWARF
ncbi:MAG: aminotransferase class V-fold PLP-dependent enzyme [Myxococcales bacterium]|nr:aminotransferase class V-fold PLP-dependent enzyme [Myxococcales bacterium]